MFQHISWKLPILDHIFKNLGAKEISIFHFNPKMHILVPFCVFWVISRQNLCRVCYLRCSEKN